MVTWIWANTGSGDGLVPSIHKPLLNQCWILITEILRYSPESNVTVSAQATILGNEFEIILFNSSYISQDQMVELWRNQKLMLTNLIKGYNLLNFSALNEQFISGMQKMFQNPHNTKWQWCTYLMINQWTRSSLIEKTACLFWCYHISYIYLYMYISLW